MDEFNRFFMGWPRNLPITHDTAALGKCILNSSSSNCKQTRETSLAYDSALECFQGGWGQTPGMIPKAWHECINRDLKQIFFEGPGTFVPQADGQAVPGSWWALGQGPMNDWTLSAVHGFDLSCSGVLPTNQEAKSFTAELWPGRQKSHFLHLQECYFCLHRGDSMSPRTLYWKIFADEKIPR